MASQPKRHREGAAKAPAKSAPPKSPPPLKRGKELAEKWIEDQSERKGKWIAWWGDKSKGQIWNAGRVIGYQYVDVSNPTTVLGEYRIDWEPPEQMRPVKEGEKRKERELEAPSASPLPNKKEQKGGAPGLVIAHSSPAIATPKQTHFNLEIRLAGKDTYFLRVDNGDNLSELIYSLPDPADTGDDPPELPIPRRSADAPASESTALTLGDLKVKRLSFEWTEKEINRLIKDQQEMPTIAAQCFKEYRKDPIAGNYFKVLAGSTLYSRLILAADQGIQALAAMEAEADAAPVAAVAENKQSVASPPAENKPATSAKKAGASAGNLVAANLGKSLAKIAGSSIGAAPPVPPNEANAPSP